MELPPDYGDSRVFGGERPARPDEEDPWPTRHLAGLNPTRSTSRCALGAALGGFLFGFDTSTINAAINGIRPDLEIGPGVTGFVTAMSLIGAAIGVWFAGPLSNRARRAPVMPLAGLVITAGSVIAAFSGAVSLLGGRSDCSTGAALARRARSCHPPSRRSLPPASAATWERSGSSRS
ncbi:MFS transporter [Micromonospora saelicesensis]|uniref:MFS transporter n=1 Tax=Micromonospora saelicesensis TaxID=285676 RepID=UPI003CF4767E